MLCDPQPSRGGRSYQNACASRIGPSEGWGTRLNVEAFTWLAPSSSRFLKNISDCTASFKVSLGGSRETIYTSKTSTSITILRGWGGWDTGRAFTFFALRRSPLIITRQALSLLAQPYFAASPFVPETPPPLPH